jgi:hypothetical protein
VLKVEIKTTNSLHELNTADGTEKHHEECCTNNSQYSHSSVEKTFKKTNKTNSRNIEFSQ